MYITISYVYILQILDPLGSTQQKREYVDLQHPRSVPTEKVRQPAQGSHTCSPGQVDPSKGQSFPKPEELGAPFYTGTRLILQHVQALLIKRFHHAVRSHKDFLAQVPLWPAWAWLSSPPSPHPHPRLCRTGPAFPSTWEHLWEWVQPLPRTLSSASIGSIPPLPNLYFDSGFRKPSWKVWTSFGVKNRIIPHLSILFLYS